MVDGGDRVTALPSTSSPVVPPPNGVGPPKVELTVPVAVTVPGEDWSQRAYVSSVATLRVPRHVYATLGLSGLVALKSRVESDPATDPFSARDQPPGTAEPGTTVPIRSTPGE